MIYWSSSRVHLLNSYFFISRVIWQFIQYCLALVCIQFLSTQASVVKGYDRRSYCHKQYRQSTTLSGFVLPLLLYQCSDKLLGCVGFCQIGEGRSLMSIFLQHFYRPIVLWKEIFSLFCLRIEDLSDVNPWSKSKMAQPRIPYSYGPLAPLFITFSNCEAKFEKRSTPRLLENQIYDCFD